MRVLVLGGSPKGDTSVTMQYVRYIQAKHPEHELEVVQVSSRISRLEKNPAAFAEVIGRVRSADAVLWAFPVYYTLVPSQYKRFIELVFERGAADAFRGRYAGVLSTSIHFYDHVASAYMREICDDLGMRYVDCLSAAMDDLLEEEGRRRTEAFADHLFDAVARRAVTARSTAPLVAPNLDYRPSPPAEAVTTGGLRIALVHDAADPGSNLCRMVERLEASFAGEATVHNLRDLDIRAGCQGCLQCARDNECVFTGKDEYIEFFSSELMGADVLVFGATVVDRNLSSLWRRFFDRSFFRNHCPSFGGRQLGFLVSGPLAQLPLLRQFLEMYAEFQEATIAGIVSDEAPDSHHLDAQLAELARSLVRNAREGFSRPPSCLGVAAHKIFRDAIYGPLRPVFMADHRYYRDHGLYDFPNRDLRRRLTSFATFQLLKVPRVRREFEKRMKDGMVAGLRKVVARAQGA